MGLDAIKAARAYVETFFDDGAAKGMKSLQRQIESMGSSMRAVGGKLIAVSAPVLGFGALAVSQFAAAGGALDDMSQRTGISVESLSELSHVAQMAGTDLESLKGSLVKQTKFLGDLQSGSKSAAATLGQLGLSAEDLQGKTSDQAFAIFADAIAGIDDEVTKANLSMEIFGNSGTDLLPILNGGSAGIEEMRKQARDLGLVMSGSDAAAAAEFGDAWDVIQSQMGSAVDQIGAALVPSLTALLQAVQPILTDGIEWLRQNDELVVTIAGVATGVLTGGAALVTMGVAAAALSTGLGGLLAIATGVAGVLGFLMSPLGVVTAGIVGLVVYTNDWSSAWSYLSTTIGESLGLAVDLVKNGEMQLAMDLVWAQIQLTWAEGVRYITTAISDVTTITVGGISNAWSNATGFLDSQFIRLEATAARTMINIQKMTGKISEANAVAALGFINGGEQIALGLQAEKQREIQDNLDAQLNASLAENRAWVSDLGGDVEALKAKLAALQAESIEINIAAEAKRNTEFFDWDAAFAEEQKRKRGLSAQPQMDFTGGALSGSFSASISRSLYSQGGESKVVSALGEVKDAVAGTTRAIENAWGKCGA